MQKNATKYILLSLAAGILFSAFILFGTLFRYDQTHQQQCGLNPIEIVGEYSEEGGPWKPLTREVFFQNLTYRDITVRGHFTRDLMLFRAIELDGWTLGVGAIFLCLTLFLLATAIGCGMIHIKGARRLLWLGLTTLFASFWFFTLSPAPTLIIPLPVFLNVLYAFSMQAMALFLVMFVMEHLSAWRKSSLNGCIALLLLLLLVGVVNQMLGIQDLYPAINYFSIFDLAIALWILYCMGYEAHMLKNREAVKLLVAMLPVIVAGLAELVNGYLQFSKAAILMGLGLIGFVVAEGIYTLHQIKQGLESEKRALVLENELQESNIRMMLSQIQPHFLYNALNTIRYFCRTQPEQAVGMLDDFSSYLRGNMESLSRSGLIPFAQELAHTQCYLNIEQARFPDLKIAYNLTVREFFIPPLTLQTIVENAVRHGATQRDEDDGTVSISTWETAGAVFIKVEDDGMGFDPNQLPEDGEIHVGIENTRKRLHAMCKGSLTIESEAGRGTIAIITIPKEGVVQ